MVDAEDIGERIARVVNWFERHPRFRALLNTALIYGGTAGLSILAHNSSHHDLEKVLDITNVAATGAYAYQRVSNLLPRSLPRDVLRAGIVAGMAYGGVGELRDLLFGYDAPDLSSKIAESIPVIARLNPLYERAAAALFGVAYLIGRGFTGYSRGRRTVPNVTA